MTAAVGPGSLGDRTIRVSAGVLVDEHGRALVVRKHGSDLYQQPGGKPDPGEDAVAALLREVREEIGVTLDAAQLDALGTFEDAAANEPGYRVVGTAFRARIRADDVTIGAEIAQARWLTPLDLETTPLAALSRNHLLPLAWSGNPHLHSPVLTGRLLLSRPRPGDVDAIFRITSDPRSWAHFTSGRHRERQQTEMLFERWDASWQAMGLGSWVARLRSTGEVIGSGGCTLSGGRVWNLGYRIAGEHHGHGYATELATAAIAHAHAADPRLPVVAFMVEHNTASARVARKCGLTLVERGPDPSNPDPAAIRLVFGERELSDAELEVIWR